MEVDARIDRLDEALGQLAAAQARTEAALKALAEAQARTEARVGGLEDRMDRVEAALARLAEAQARTEARVEQLDAAITRLADAQARTEARVERLEEAVTRLAEAQARTEERLERLEAAVQALAQQVGRLAETIGFTLEDLAREVAPAYLAQHCGIHVRELERRFILVDGREVEVDLYGEGRRDEEAVVVVGEVRSRIHGRDVEAAFRQARRVTAGLPGSPVTVLFGFVIHPSAREVADRLGAIVISSSGR